MFVFAVFINISAVLQAELSFITHVEFKHPGRYCLYEMSQSQDDYVVTCIFSLLNAF